MGNLVKEMTSMEKDFAQWYTDVVIKAELIDYSSVRGCTVLRPYGFSIWENITKILDNQFKKIGIENVSMPLLIPESLLQKEKDHIKGFAPEVAWVTVGGKEILSERLCVRPTSETLFCSHFQRIVHSWRDLPKLYNQWCSVVRWEKTSRPFLRSVEFHWQEGHTLHESAESAHNFTLKMLYLYADFFKNVLCIPVILGQKTESEKFAGAEKTYTVECMMKDGKALQSATSHYLGQGFTKAFDIKFTDKENKEVNPYYTSWGLSTRIIASVIMSHGDDDGLVLPPKISPIQVIITPINFRKDSRVLEKSYSVLDSLSENFRCKIDDSDQSPGWKFANYDMKGVPIRLEIGPKDIDSDSCVLVRRDTHEKIKCGFSGLVSKISEMFEEIEKDLYNKATSNMQNKTIVVSDISDFEKHNGFIKAPFCCSSSCEERIKEKYGFTTRCIPFNDSVADGNCIVCNKKVKNYVYFARAY